MVRDTTWIGVSGEVYRELNRLKRPGETYDDLLGGLVEEHKHRRLFDLLEDIEEATDTWTSLEDLPPVDDTTR